MSDKAKDKIPEEFDSLEEEAEFWENFDTSKVWNDLEEADDVEFEQPDKQVVSFRMRKDLIEKIKRYARSLDTPYTSLMRLWVVRAFKQEVQSDSAKNKKSSEDYYTPQYLTRPISSTAQQQTARMNSQEAVNSPVRKTEDGLTEIDAEALEPHRESKQL